MRKLRLGAMAKAEKTQKPTTNASFSIFMCSRCLVSMDLGLSRIRPRERQAKLPREVLADRGILWVEEPLPQPLGLRLGRLLCPVLERPFLKANWTEEQWGVRLRTLPTQARGARSRLVSPPPRHLKLGHAVWRGHGGASRRGHIATGQAVDLSVRFHHGSMSSRGNLGGPNERQIYGLTRGPKGEGAAGGVVDSAQSSELLNCQRATGRCSQLLEVGERPGKGSIVERLGLGVMGRPVAARAELQF